MALGAGLACLVAEQRRLFAALRHDGGSIECSLLYGLVWNLEWWRLIGQTSQVAQAALSQPKQAVVMSCCIKRVCRVCRRWETRISPELGDVSVVVKGKEGRIGLCSGWGARELAVYGRVVSEHGRRLRVSSELVTWAAGTRAPLHCRWPPAMHKRVPLLMRGSWGRLAGHPVLMHWGYALFYIFIHVHNI